MKAEVGNATLYLGDAYEIVPTLGHVLLVMDPPYEFDNSGGGEYRKARGASDQIVEEGLDQGFDHSIINTLLHRSAIIFCHNDQLPELLGFLAANFFRVCVNVWVKPNPPPHRNRHYLADTEFFVHAWQHGFHPVGQHHDMHRHVTANPPPSKVFNHPTVKPDAVMDKIVRNVPDGVICDPFMGTGSTGLAALKAGRRFIGVEKNPAHFETAVRRLTEFTQAAGAAA